jgi:hypothetical protein
VRPNERAERCPEAAASAVDCRVVTLCDTGALWRRAPPCQPPPSPPLPAPAPDGPASSAMVAGAVAAAAVQRFTRYASPLVISNDLGTLLHLCKPWQFGCACAACALELIYLDSGKRASPRQLKHNENTTTRRQAC